MKGFIYKIYDNTNGNTYYGSTKQQVSRRIGDHRQDYKRYLKGSYGYCKSFDIIKNCDYSYNIVEEVEYGERWELLNKERWYIENNVCINKMLPFKTEEELKEKHNDRAKKYRETEKYKKKIKLHTENTFEERKKYREENKEKNKEYQKKYRETHKEKNKEYQKKYQKENMEFLSAYKKEWAKGNHISKKNISPSYT